MDQAQAQPPSHYEQVVLEREAAMRAKEQAFILMNQLNGWCTFEKAGILIDLILKNRPETIVEIGVWGGKSLVPMAYALHVNQKGKIYGIDPWSSAASLQNMQNESNKAYWGAVNHEAVMKDLIYRIEVFGLRNRIELVRDTSEGADPIPNIDMLHVDGNHSDKTSYFDVQKWVPLVRSGGLIIFDDMTWYENGTFTTARAVEWLNQHCMKFAEFQDDSVWGIWIKP